MRTRTTHQQLQAMIELLAHDSQHITLVRHTDVDGPVFKTSIECARHYSLLLNNHGWAINTKMGKQDANNRYIKVYYNKPQRLMSEADIERLSK